MKQIYTFVAKIHVEVDGYIIAESEQDARQKLADAKFEDGGKTIEMYADGEPIRVAPCESILIETKLDPKENRDIYTRFKQRRPLCIGGRVRVTEVFAFDQHWTDVKVGDAGTIISLFDDPVERNYRPPSWYVRFDRTITRTKDVYNKYLREDGTFLMQENQLEAEDL